MPKAKQLPADTSVTPDLPPKELRRARPPVEETTEARALSEAVADVATKPSIEESIKQAPRKGGRPKGDDTKDFNVPLTAEERELLAIATENQKPLSTRYVSRTILVAGLKAYAKEHGLDDPTEM